MSRYITTQCCRCKNEAGVSLNDVIKNKDYSAMPSGWNRRDLGDFAEEAYTLCNKCFTEYRAKEEKFYRDYLTLQSKTL